MSKFPEPPQKAPEQHDLSVVEKGGEMDYEAPAVDVMGSASELIQDYAGPRYDGDGSSFSQAAICSPLEEDNEE